MLDDLQEARLRAAIASHHLTSNVEEIVALARIAIRLVLTDEVGLDNDTRLGGTASLPKGMEWPCWEGQKQALIAQVMLRDVLHSDVEEVLPREGRLLFFYDVEQRTWGFDPLDRGSWKVLFVAGDTVTTAWSHAVYTSRRLKPMREISIPPWESLPFGSLHLSDEEAGNYIELCESFRPDSELVNKMLGYPEPVQGAMEVECQLASSGMYCGDPDAYKDPRTAELRGGAIDWRLLLQVDSEEAVGMMWGDVRRLYYWIRDQDLRFANFDESWLILQCC